MTYSTPVVKAKFLSRPNRFIALVELNGEILTVHVKNTGRCKELLPEGATVYLAAAENPARKTPYDLVAVEKVRPDGSVLFINMDSQAPNTAAREWLLAGGLGQIDNLRPETVHGGSRFDFSFTKDGRPCLLEVKGVTLENDGVCAFPDAPTQRGARHLRHLAQAVQEGYGAYVLFVIQMSDVQYLHPNDATDPEFGAALRQAHAAGVQVLAMDCRVEINSMTIDKPVAVIL